MKIMNIFFFPRQNLENHEIHRIPYKNKYNQENVIIQRQNHEVMKFIGLHARITKIMQI